MSKENIKFGNVDLDVHSVNQADKYSDSAEDTLLNLFSSKESSIKSQRDEILNNNPSWALLYHLTPKRSNLLKWYDFEKGSNILEIGAGCGAVTESLLQFDANVTALELSKKRATINALRNKNAANLELIVSNLENYKPKQKFDYIVCVGVLEYSGTFIKTSDPYLDFLKHIYRLLRRNGRCLIAIENRLGLKYWSGAQEDHVPRYFAGLNGYPTKKKVQTFGKKELSDLLASASFKSPYFYYPFPDYKTPVMVYSDDYYPGNNATFPLGLLPTPTFDRKREHLFSEQSAIRYIESNDLFPHFSNSFLVEVIK